MPWLEGGEVCMLGTWGACSLSLAGNTIAPSTPERQQLPWGSPMAGKPHGRPLNLEQLPSPRQQLGPAGHKSLMTQAERGQAVGEGEGEGEEQAGGGSETLSLPSTPKPHPLPPSPGWRLCILWANFS